MFGDAEQGPSGLAQNPVLTASSFTPAPPDRVNISEERRRKQPLAGENAPAPHGPLQPEHPDRPL